MDELQQYLEKRSSHYMLLSKLNYYSAYACALVATLASFFAGLSIAGDLFPKLTLTFITAAPGALLVLNSTFRFQTRSHWHQKKSYLLQGLLRGIKYENRPIEEISKQITELDIALADEWSEISALAIKAEQGGGGETP